MEKQLRNYSDLIRYFRQKGAYPSALESANFHSFDLIRYALPLQQPTPLTIASVHLLKTIFYTSLFPHKSESTLLPQEDKSGLSSHSGENLSSDTTSVLGHGLS